MKSIFENILILAGGDGTRYWPLVHKNSVDYCGRTLLEHQIERLRPYTGNVVVVVNPGLRDAVSQKSGITVAVQENVDEGQAGAVLSARDLVKGEVLIVNANDIFDTAVLPEMLQKIESDGLEFAFLAKKVSSYFPGGYVAFDGTRVTGIVEKPPADQVPSDTVKLVVDYVSDYQSLAEKLQAEDDNTDDRYERGLNALIGAGKKTSVVYYDSFWHTVKFSWQVLEMLHYFLFAIKEPAIDPSAQVSPRAVVTGPVHIGSNARIGDFAKIVGPCYIGDDVIIGDYAMVRDSQICRGTLVGGYSEVTRSYLGEGVMLHRNYVGDSVLDVGVLMGAQAVTANFRFDKGTVKSAVKGTKIDTGLSKMGTIAGAGAKIGVNSTVLPGVKIGINTFVGPHEVVGSDVEDNVFVFQGQKRQNDLGK